LDVTALSYLAPSKVKFRYRLEGIDESWSEPTLNRKIEYTNLPYGDYELKVIASNNDGIWSEKGTSLSFSVLPFIFETIQFKIGMVLIFILLFRLFYVWRVRDIKKTNKVLKKMNAELDKFVYSASHDLRGPLTSTMGLVNLGLVEKSAEKKNGYFELIQKCTYKMDHFINELINYSKNKNDKIELSELSISVIIEEVLQDLSEKGLTERVDIEINIDGEDSFIADETRVKVILRNLLHNALVFSDPGKPAAKVVIDARWENKEMCFTVSDNGIGMSTNVLDKIFNMFFRANAMSKGSGLGLYISKEVANKLKAVLFVSSVEGEGSEFTLKLPQMQ
jgi:signal transduction histidine kinase